MNWRKADAIQLLDALTCVKIKSFDAAMFGELESTYQVMGSDLVDLAILFGVETHRGAVLGRSQAGGKEITRKAENFTLSIYPGEGENWECDALQAALEGGFLHIRIGNKDPETGEITSWEHTYNGRFVVHWAAAPSE